MVTSESEAVLERALNCLETRVAQPLTGPETLEWSERCVEVPWVSAHIRNAKNILDVGWTMAPPEWLGVLLACRRSGSQLRGIDIIDPYRVRTRFPTSMLAEIDAVPVDIEDILVYEPDGSDFDLLTCISTLEHIGFDEATPEDIVDTVFQRPLTAEDAQPHRSPETDTEFLNAAVRLLQPGGRLLLTVPAGANRPVLKQDSLGRYTYFFEYGQSTWQHILEDARFAVTDSAYFTWSAENGWHEKPSIQDLAHQASDLQPFALGCACVELTLL